MPTHPAEFEAFFALDGSVLVDWSPPRMEFLEMNENGAQLTYSDFPWLGAHAPILRESAITALGPILETYGQVLPLEGAPVWLFNVTRVLPALDEQRSKIVRFDDGDILAIEEHVFLADEIGGNEIFKLAGRASMTFVTQRFVERVRDAGLRGVCFEMLWSDEGRAMPERIEFA